MTSKAVAYMRLSADEKRTGSISFSVQEQGISRVADTAGLQIIEYVQDNAVSGATGFAKREGGRRVLDLLESGKVSSIVALRSERMFRNTIEALTCVEDWTNRGFSVYFADDGGMPLDASTPSGKMIFSMRAVVATYERDQIALRIRENKFARRAQGLSYSPPRYGFDQVDGKDVPNLREQQAIALMVDLRKQGLSLRGIARSLGDAGFGPKRGAARWSAQAVKDILSRQDSPGTSGVSGTGSGAQNEQDRQE